MTRPDGVPRFPTSLGASDPDTITLLGRDLAADLMGKVGFGELALWLVTQRRPTPSQVRAWLAGPPGPLATPGAGPAPAGAHQRGSGA